MSHFSTEDNNRTITRSASITLVGMLYQLTISFVSGIILARMMGPASYGLFNLTRSLCETTNVFTKIGFDLGLVRHFGEHPIKSSSKDAGAGFLKLVLLAVTMCSLLPVAAVFMGGGSYLAQNVYTFPDFERVAKAMVWLIPLMTFSQVLGGAFRGNLKLGPMVISEYFVQPTSRLAFIALFLLLGWDIWAAIVGTILSFALTAVFLLALANRLFFSHQPNSSILVTQAAHRNWREVLRVGKYSMVISLTLSAAFLLSKIDILMLGYYRSPKEVGQYTAIQMIVVLIGLFNAALNQGIAPMMARLYLQNERSEMARLIQQHTRWVALCSLPIFLILSVLGNKLMMIFGSEYQVDNSVIAILALTQFLIAVFSTAGFMLSMTGQHVREFLTMLSALLCNIALCFLLIPKYGLLGAAISTLVAIVLANCMRIYQVYRIYRIFPFSISLIRPIFIGFISILLFLSIANSFELTRSILAVVVISMLCTIFYAWGMFHFGVNTSERVILTTLILEMSQKLRRSR